MHGDQEKITDTENTRHIVMKIDGMMCSHCQGGCDEGAEQSAGCDGAGNALRRMRLILMRHTTRMWNV